MDQIKSWGGCCFCLCCEIAKRCFFQFFSKMRSKTVSYRSIFCTGAFFKSIVQECSGKCRQECSGRMLNRSFGAVLSKSARILSKEGFCSRLLLFLQEFSARVESEEVVGISKGACGCLFQCFSFLYSCFRFCFVFFYQRRPWSGYGGNSQSRSPKILKASKVPKHMGLPLFPMFPMFSHVFRNAGKPLQAGFSRGRFPWISFQTQGSYIQDFYRFFKCYQ